MAKLQIVFRYKPKAEGEVFREIVVHETVGNFGIVTVKLMIRVFKKCFDEVAADLKILSRSKD
jgi:hypothetical protein